MVHSVFKGLVNPEKHSRKGMRQKLLREEKKRREKEESPRGGAVLKKEPV